MKDLKCGLTDCKHNKGYCCCAKIIDVDSRADCLTYTPLLSKSNMEAGRDLVKANYNVDTKVGCTADCIFNKNRECKANGITVMSEENTPAACLTFIKS